MTKDINQPKYLKLKEYLKGEMLMGRIKPGEQIPSEHSLAEMFTISRHTVRKAVSILINEGYLTSEHGRGTYCLDRSHKRSTSRNIGVITTYMSDYIFPKVIQGIDSVLSQNGYSIILKNTNNDTINESNCLKDMLEKNVEGLIIEPTKSALFSRNLELFKALDSCGIPFVFIHGYHQNLEDKPYVILDDAAGMYSAVRYLAGLGHKKITGIFKADDIQGLNRHEGYVRALADSRISYDPDNVILFHTEDKEVKPVNFIRDMIMSGSRMDAVVCYNDEIAFKVFQLVEGMGLKVPEDISITGFDDSYLSENGAVRLTSVSHPKERLGMAAAELLLDILSGRNDAADRWQQVIVPELIIKDSCKKRQ
ncbi:MAG: GntR family transcriptional regulator [Clostridiaceae bacterium]|jgi:GntR family transcriptional regulator of arabinose operon|nr:GntR family transcriptional regulator [Clostridiaceae bacterium]